MNFLLTGATGFIGERLIRRIHEGGHFVSLFTRHVREREDRNVGQFFWDMKGLAPSEPFRHVDCVIHLAGEPVAQRWTPETKRRIRDSRILGTRHLVTSIARLEAPPKILISASAVGYYGSRGDELLTEQSPAGTGFLAETCVAWENEADWLAELDVRVVKVRIGIVLGPEGGALKKMLLPFRFGLGGPLGNGKQWMSWIHVDDLVEMILFAAMNASVRGAINGVGPAPVTNRDFTRALGAALHRPAVLPAPEFALRAALGEMAEVVLGSQRVLPKAAEQAGFGFRYNAIDKALAACVER